MRQQNLLDELKTRAKSIATTVETAHALILDDPSADLSKPVIAKTGLLADTDESKEIPLALGAADKLLASRLLDLSVVLAASTNAVGWTVVEALTGASWRDYCTDEKHALVVKDSLAAQEKRASYSYDRDRKDRGRSCGGGFNNSEGCRSRRSHRAGFDDAAGDAGSWNTYNGRYIPPPAGAPPRSAAPGSAAGGMAANRSSGSFHSQNDFCYKCTQPGHRSSNCPNPPAPGRF